MIGHTELILILAVILLLFGADKLPEIARSIGNAAKEFKKAQIMSENKLENESENFEIQSEHRDKKILKLANEMGIDTKNRTIEQIADEIRLKVETYEIKK